MDFSSASTQGLWATFEASLTDHANDFKNPFEYDVWVLLIEIGHISDDQAINTVSIKSRHNLYTNLISSMYSSQHYLGGASCIRAEAGYYNGSSNNFGHYVFWRKSEYLKIESKKGNFIRITGQLISTEYYSN